MPRHPPSRSVKRVFRSLKPYQLVVDVVVAAVFFAVAWPVESVMFAGMGLEARFGSAIQLLSGAIVGALFAAALAVRRLAPALSLGLAWAGALVQMALGRPPSFSDIAIFAVLYATAAYGSRAVYWAGFGSALLGALVITVYLMAGPGFSNGLPSWSAIPAALLMLVAAAFALGLSWTVGALVRTAIRARENRAAQERAEAEAVVEQERVRIARDMHDVVAHSLAVVIAQADGARYAAVADPSAATQALGTISATARTALADVRLLLTQLRHSQGDGPQPTLADLEQLYAQVRAAGVALRVEVDPMPPAPSTGSGPASPGTVPGAVQLAVYRILQEALTNALRHGAEGGTVDVRLAWLPDRVELSVRNGMPASRGAASPSVTTEGAASRGHGVIGMRERAQVAGGHLDAGAEGDAFVVRASIPVGGSA